MPEHLTVLRRLWCSALPKVKDAHICTIAVSHLMQVIHSHLSDLQVEPAATLYSLLQHLFPHITQIIEAHVQRC